MSETADTIDLDRLCAIAGAVPDPEIPVLTLADLGVIRAIRREATTVVIEISPTYIGCPAVLAIELAVEAALRDAGYADIRIARVLSPAWSTDDISPEGREKLRVYGIAPPTDRKGKSALLFIDDTVACPRCGSTSTHKVSEFGSTACKALWACDACREPFDYFKCI